MDKYRVRRAILEAIRSYEPAPAETSDVMLYPPLEMADIAADRISEELRALAEREYIKNLRPGRVPLWRLTGAGRGQIKQEDDLREFIWGEFASRFSA